MNIVQLVKPVTLPRIFALHQYHVHQRLLRSVRPSQDTVAILILVQELLWTICVQEDRITNVAQECQYKRMSVQQLEELVKTFVGVMEKFFMVTVLLSTILSNAVRDHHQTQLLNYVMVEKGRKDKLSLVHQRQQMNAKHSQVTVVTQTHALELSLMVFALEDKITSVVKECHSRRMSVQQLEEHVEIFVGVMEKFSMVIVHLSTTLSNAVRNHHLIQHLKLRCVRWKLREEQVLLVQVQVQVQVLDPALEMKIVHNWSVNQV